MASSMASQLTKYVTVALSFNCSNGDIKYAHYSSSLRSMITRKA